MLIAFWSCEEEDEKGEPDFENPNIDNIRPYGENVTGNVLIEVDVWEDDCSNQYCGINRVEFYIRLDMGYSLLFTDTEGPYEYNWNTDDYDLGTSYEIKVIAYDDAENSASISKTYKVDKYVELFGELYSIVETEYIELNNIINGEIPNEVFNLVNLKRLIIKDNPELTGSIPIAIGNLSNLTQLIIENNEQLSGEIPLEIGLLQDLDDLSLKNNNLSGQIPLELFNSRKLIRVDLNNNQLDGEFTSELVDAILLNPDMNAVSLNDNHLSGNFPENVCDLIDFTSIHLLNNRFCPPYPSNGSDVDIYEDNCIFYQYGGDGPFHNQDCCGGDLISEDCVRDIDGNGYPVVHLGSQSWMAENLKVSHYNNGDPIQYLPEYSEDDVIAGYTYDWEEGRQRGYYYNWYAVNDERNICPAGWHIPTDAEFKQLERYLGMSIEQSDLEAGNRGEDEGSALAGYKYLQLGNGGWRDHYLIGDSRYDSTGFDALAAGRMNPDYEMELVVDFAFYWTNTESSDSTAWSRYLYEREPGISRAANDNIVHNIPASNKNYGHSCRCVKD